MRMMLEAAVNGRADILVTFDLRDFGLAPARFGVEALLPREVIGRFDEGNPDIPIAAAAFAQRSR